MAMLPDLNLIPPEENIPEDGAEEANVAQANDEAQPEGRQVKKDLPDDHRFAAYFALKVISKIRDKEIEKKDKELVAGLLQTSIRTVEMIWKEANEQLATGENVDVRSKKKGRSGRKRKDIDLGRMSTIPLNRRSTVRGLARELHVDWSTLYRRFKWGEIKRHTSSLKPFLKPANKIQRLQFCISMLDERTIEDVNPTFSAMHNIVHIDEKLFYMTEKNKTYYLLPDEPAPLRTVHNKNCIGKVMFLTAVTRPRNNSDGLLTFDGKIGTWAFVQEVAAVRNSQNRDRGTLELKNITVTREIMRLYICEKVVPAIQDQWPMEDFGKTVYIQQDNARTHILPNDPVFQQKVAETDLDIKIIQQPPNSPDMNVLDLSFFRSLQSLTQRRAPTTIEELIHAVKDEFDNYDPLILDRTFITLQSCMLESMKVDGGLHYNTPHMNKEAMQRSGTLPNALTYDGDLYHRTLQLIAQGAEG